MPKISALPLTGSSTANDYVISNNSGETLTSKIQLKNLVGLTIGTGANTIKSADYLTTNPNHTDGTDSVLIGSGNSGYTGSDRNVLVGLNNKSESVDMVVIGNNNKDQGSGRDRSVVIGLNNEAYQTESTQIGYDNAGVSQTVGIGKENRPIGTGCLGIGFSNIVAGSQGIAHGWDNFEDRSYSIAMGFENYADGTYDVVIGTQNRTDNDKEGKIAIGYSNLVDTAERQIVMGYNNFGRAFNSIVISNDETGTGTGSANTIIIGGSGHTFGSQIGFGNVLIGGFNHNWPYQMSNSVILGGSGLTFNPTGGLNNNNVALGLKNRTIGTGAEDLTLVENLFTFGQHTFQPTGYTLSGDVIFNPNTHHYVNITATGGTYNVKSIVNPLGPSKQVVFYIEYFSGATINFVDGTGFISWRWSEAYGKTAPVFSASTAVSPSRSIITVSTWDNEDYFEVSRSMNME